MSNLEKNAIQALKDIKNICLDIKQVNREDYYKIIYQCDNIINEYEARKKRLGEKENLSKDTK